MATHLSGIAGRFYHFCKGSHKLNLFNFAMDLGWHLEVAKHDQAPPHNGFQ